MVERRSMTKSQLLLLECLLKYQKAVIPCHRCRVALQWGDKIEREHIHPLALGGTDKPDNWRFSHADCHAVQTKEDMKAIAKGKRIQGKTKTRNKADRFSGPRRGVDVLVEEDAAPASGKTPCRKLQSRGFDKTRRKKMNGDVVDRASHRAAVEAGYASHADYIERWGKDKE